MGKFCEVIGSFRLVNQIINAMNEPQSLCRNFVADADKFHADLQAFEPDEKTRRISSHTSLNPTGPKDMCHLRCYSITFSRWH